MNTHCLLPELGCRYVEASGVQYASSFLRKNSMNSPQWCRNVRRCSHLCASILDEANLCSTVQDIHEFLFDCRASQTRPTRPSARWKTVPLGSFGLRFRYAAMLKTMAAAAADQPKLGIFSMCQPLYRDMLQLSPEPGHSCSAVAAQSVKRSERAACRTYGSLPLFWWPTCRRWW